MAAPSELELVVGNVNYGENVIVLPRSVAAHLCDLWCALGAPTWGALRLNSSAGVYQEVLGQAGYGSLDDFMSKLSVGVPVPGAEATALKAFAEKIGEPLPADEEPFDAYSDVASVADGDFPPAPGLLMLGLLPTDVIETYGTLTETTFNGTLVDFQASQRDQIIAALEADGYHCTVDEELIRATQAD